MRHDAPPRRTAAERRRDRARGVDRYGKPLPRTLGTNPRALRQPDGSADAAPGRTPPAGDEDGARPDAPLAGTAPPAAPLPAAPGGPGSPRNTRPLPRHGDRSQAPAGGGPPQGVDGEQLVGQGEAHASDRSSGPGAAGC